MFNSFYIGFVAVPGNKNKLCFSSSISCANTQKLSFNYNKSGILEKFPCNIHQSDDFLFNFTLSGNLTGIYHSLFIILQKLFYNSTSNNPHHTRNYHNSNRTFLVQFQYLTSFCSRSDELTSNHNVRAKRISIC